ncbi:MAG: hypothetical protein IKT25_08760, partial [Firmicutes bacterium]|nr:hypothetical protein [Bacillota bacterium]
MTPKYEQDVLHKLKRRKLKRFWSRVVTAMMCVVVFCTTYALILPAITQETDTFCGMDAHTHTEDCYPKQSDLICEFADTEIHIHTESCNPTLDTVPNCGLEEIASHSHDENCALVEEQLICTLEETEGHTHSDACAPVEEKTLICTLTETEGHTHSEACAPTTVQNLICTLAETEGHAHSDACYTVSTVYGCGLAEAAARTHAEACYTVDTVYGCGLEAVEAHAHTDACYNVNTTYGCGLEEVEAHAHTEACYNAVYSCGLEETEGHAHTEACFPTIYGCGLEGVEHTHIETCYNTSPVLICELAEDETHSHSAECYDNTLLCGLEEHEHELECYSDPSADVEDASVWEATLPTNLSGTHAENLLAVAGSQAGYVESTKNYIVDESGEIKGYTRYGAWSGIPYEDWSAMFVSFCLHYAQVDVIPQNTLCPAWVHSLRSIGMYQPAADYTPIPGDLIFFDRNGDGSADHVGIVATFFPAEDRGASRVQTIEGDSANEVRYNSYNLANATILGYGTLVAPQSPVEEEPVEEPQPGATISPNNTDAWAVVVGSTSESTEELASSPTAATTFSLRRTAATFQMTPRMGTPLNLTPYITNVSMYDANGKPLPSGSVVSEGDLIEFKISYTIKGQQFGVMNGEEYQINTDTVVYPIPSSFQVIQDKSGNIVNSFGETVGTYSIQSNEGSNSTITMVFLDDYVKDNIKGLAITGHISFFSTVVKITDEENEEQGHKFSDKFTLGIIVQEEEEIVGDLKIEKKKTNVDGNVLTYEIIVTSEEGTTGPVTITDKMTKGLTFKKGISVQDGSGNIVNVPFNPSSDKSSYTMTLPEMEPGDSYVIRYQCEADVDLLGADMTVRNTASVTGKDSDGKDLKHEVTVDHTFDMLDKTGVKNDNGTISWTITINRAKVDISGWILEDIIRNGTTQTPYRGPVTIKDSRGNVIAENATLPYTFPNGSNDTYTVTYTTTHNYGESDTIFNTATLKHNDTEVGDVTGVGIGTPFTKSGQMGEVTQIDGKYVLPITWTVTIDTRNGSIPAGSEIYDVMQGSYHTGEMYMDYTQLMAAFNAIEAALGSAGSSVDTISAEEYLAGYSGGSSHNKNDLLNNNACRSLLYERFTVKLGSDIPKGKILTFSYTAYGVFENNLVKDTEFKNRISLSDKYVVEASERYVSGTIWANKVGLQLYDPNSPTGAFDWKWDQASSEYNYSQLHDSYLAWAVDVMISPGYSSTDDVTVYEDLPDGLDVRRLDIKIPLTVPTGERFILEKPEIGQTYTWNIVVYPPEYYIDGSNRIPTNVSILIKYTEEKDLEIILPGELLSPMGQWAAMYNKVYPAAPLDSWYAMFYIYTQIEDDFDWTPDSDRANVYVNAFKNNYRIYKDDGETINFGSHTQTITKDESTGSIRKKATADENNIVHYSVVLNAYGRDLVENASTLSVHDELTYTSTAADPLRMRLVPGSVKLYEIRLQSDGTYTKLGEVTTNYSYNESSTEQAGTTAWTHTLDLTIPDGKALVLEYSYKATGITSSHHNVSNTCTISGAGDGNIDSNHRLDLEVKQSSAQADNEGIMIYKVDSNSDGIYLENAKFNIYIWNEDQDQYIIVHHPNNGDTEFTTNSKGMIILDGSTIDDEQFAYNTAYYIVEVESPNGYYLSPEPYYFYLVNEDTTAHPLTLPDGFNGHALTNGDIIYRKNVSALTEITIEKSWLDYGGNPVTVTAEKVPSITVELWRKLEGVPNSDERYDTYSITPDDDGNWSLTITGLPKAT